MTAAAAGCLPSLRGQRAAPCGWSSHHPSLCRLPWPACPPSLPTRRRWELLTAGLLSSAPAQGSAACPRLWSSRGWASSVLLGPELWSPRRDVPACAHTHSSLSAMGRPHVLCWAQASASPLGAQSGRHRAFLFSAGLHPQAEATVRAVPSVCTAHEVTPEPRSTDRVVSAGTGSIPDLAFGPERQSPVGRGILRKQLDLPPLGRETDAGLLLSSRTALRAQPGPCGSAVPIGRSTGG